MNNSPDLLVAVRYRPSHCTSSFPNRSGRCMSFSDTVALILDESSKTEEEYGGPLGLRRVRRGGSRSPECRLGVENPLRLIIGVDRSRSL